MVSRQLSACLERRLAATIVEKSSLCVCILDRYGYTDLEPREQSKLSVAKLATLSPEAFCSIATNQPRKTGCIPCICCLIPL